MELAVKAGEFAINHNTTRDDVRETLESIGRLGREELSIGMFGAEPWTGAMRSEIEAGFDMQALDV